MAFSNPIFGGEVLIRSSVHSPDYVPGASGWTLNKDGSVEFGEAVIRGTIDIAAGVVTIDNNGITVEDATHRFTINVTGGIRAINKPIDGSYVTIQDQAVYHNPTDPFGGFAVDDGYVAADTSSTGGSFVYTEIASPAINGNDRAYVRLWGESAAGASEPVFDFGSASNGAFAIDRIRIPSDTPIEDYNGIERYGNGRWNLTTRGTVANLTTTSQVVFTFISATYKAGRAYEILIDGSFFGGNNPSVQLRKGTTTGSPQVVDGGRVQLSAASTFNMRIPLIFVVSGGSDVTTQLCITMTSQATTTLAIPSRAIISDIGKASDYSDYTATNTLS